MGASSRAGAETSQHRQRTLRWTKALRSGTRRTNPWQHGPDDDAPTARGHIPSVNADTLARETPSSEGGCGDEREGYRRGNKLRRVFASGKVLRQADRPRPPAAKSRTGASKPGEPHDRLQGATNLQTVEAAVFGSRLCGENRRSREERQGRNARGTWQSFAEAWATVQAGVDAGDGRVGEGASMNPMRGVQLLGRGLRAVPGGLGPREPVCLRSGA